jgi:site-specific DNA-methyltransferase (adenine-specific)
MMPECQCRKCGKQFNATLRAKHHLLCGDARNREDVERLFAGVKANVVITSPPYASQRKYDESSDFRPIPPDQYVEWFRDVAANIAAVLAPGGSFFLNLKEHADDGQRSLYVKDLTLAHVREWGWRFVDELCWRKTDNGVPGSWPNKFKNAWEPVFHFTRDEKISFHPYAVSHQSNDCFDYSPDNPKSTSGSGLLGSGKRGRMAGNQSATVGAAQTTRPSDEQGRFAGLARPSNVIEAKSESGQGCHSAPFPRALVEFFVKAFSDAGDIVFDCFMGSGSSMAAAHVLDRKGYGCEISPAYCDVIVRRIMNLGAGIAILESTGQTFDEVAADRRVPGPAEATA